MSHSQTNPVAYMNAGTCGILIAIGHLQINCPHENCVRSPPSEDPAVPSDDPQTHTQSGGQSTSGPQEAQGPREMGIEPEGRDSSVRWIQCQQFVVNSSLHRLVQWTTLRETQTLCGRRKGEISWRKFGKECWVWQEG